MSCWMHGLVLRGQRKNLALASVVGLLLLASGVGELSGATPWLTLPTENRALFDGAPEDFYMFVERDFEGQKSRPWEGGTYGFTRNPQRVGGRLIYTRFHEGIDVKPIRRTATGEPLDPVVAAADGVVVHVSTEASASTYGRYVVVKHDLGGSPYFTLYSHLGDVQAREGQQVRQGEALGILGYTGRGINRERAHLHFEFCLLASRAFDAWFAHYLPNETNRHGVFNGMNLLGLDPAQLLQAVRERPGVSVPEFVSGMRPLLRLIVPDSPYFDLPKLYPWMLAPGSPARAPSWAVTFSDTLIPMRIEPRSSVVTAPEVEWLGDDQTPLRFQSRGWVAGSAQQPQLTDSGVRFAHLLIFPPAPAPFRP